MIGFNDAVIEMDTCFTNATGDNPYATGNALTIRVFDQSTIPLSQSTVYIEDWGTQSTGIDHKITFTGLGNDEYQYRASKPNYRDRGFKSIILTADESANYILDKISTVHQVKESRFTNRMIKDIYLPMMYILLIVIIFGAFKYVSN